MTLYLKVAVGRAGYLIAAAQVADVGPAEGAVDDDSVDCRRWFGAPEAASGYRIRLSPEAGLPGSLIVDRLDGLVELGEGAFRKLPGMGRLGGLIDAVSLPVSGELPALRLRLEPALLLGAWLPRGEIDAGSGDPAAR